jgi:alanyl-tRNA synthetase
MNAQEIRQQFLDFFKDKEHQIVPSAPLVVKDDPTLMFTNAGMNQFKDFFLGTKDPSAPRIADTQKCLRVSGKHNDLEEVGLDTYHHTMFEMLGNWSFGDYFKKEAIAWAWQLLTEVYKLPADRLYATVFGGDRSEDLEKDTEARAIWSSILPASRILDGSKKDNFWEMGETGPCGPCSEVHIDLRPEEEINNVPGSALVNQDHPLVIEIWNLVFIQFNRRQDGSLENLPSRHVDTGMGFERLVMAIQGKTSNYDTDVFTPLIKAITEAVGKQYGVHRETDIAIRVVADHVRAVAFAIADGQLPSNTGAGYVIRRILRRAVRYGFTFLECGEPFIYTLVPVLARQMGNVFSEIIDQQDFVAKVIREEEAAFLRTLENGIRIFEAAYAESKRKAAGKAGGVPIPGETAFRLYDTFGFPIDLTLLLAREKGAEVDMKTFEILLKQQKDRSRSAAQQEQGDWIVLDRGKHSEFTGYGSLESSAHITRYRTVKDKKKTLCQIVLDRTPFYAESGGQVGDTGYIESGEERIAILDTQKEHEMIVHLTDTIPGNPEAEFHCVVDAEKRRQTENNHSATHLLHAALREVLGPHVQQKGSLVSDKALRFDFSHYAKVTEEELDQIERIVNRKIREDIALDEKRNVPLEEAKAMGAMALFGEKYGDHVRVISFDPSYSVELCGGTHVQRTGQIGLLKIISEASIAAGVRRIEAITADRAEAYVRESLDLLGEVKAIYNNPKDVVKAIRGTLEERDRLAGEIERLHAEKAQDLKRGLIDRAEKKKDGTMIVGKVDLNSAEALRQMAFELRRQVDGLFLVLAADVQGKPLIAVMLDERLIEKYGLHAGKMVKELAAEIQGGGGGQPFFATAGGKDASGLDKVVRKARHMAEILES